MVVPALAEARLQQQPVGRYAFAVLLFQDLAVAPLLFMVTMLGGGRRRISPGGWRSPWPRRRWRSARYPDRAAGAAAAVSFRRADRQPGILHGRLPSGRARHGLIASASGLSMALGAFLAGLLLAETEYPARDRGDHRAVQGPAARAVLRLDRRGARSVAGAGAAGAGVRDAGRLRRAQGGHRFSRSRWLSAPRARRRGTSLWRWGRAASSPSC